MWVLLLVIFGGATTDDTTSFIEKYTTQKDCEETRDYVMTEMTKAYANDTQRFELTCVYRGATT